MRNAGTMVVRTLGASQGGRRRPRDELCWAIAPRFSRGFECGPQETRNVWCSVARSWIRRGESCEGKVAWSVKACGHSDVWRVTLGSSAAFGWRSSWTWGRSVFLRSVYLKRPGGQRWDASIEASVGVVLLMPVTNFLSLAPDIVWRGTVEDWSLAPGVASKGNGVRVGTCSDRQCRSGFAKMQGWPAGKRAVAPSIMFRQRGRGERHWVALHLFWDDASEKETEVGAAARELVMRGV